VRTIHPRLGGSQPAYLKEMAQIPACFQDGYDYSIYYRGVALEFESTKLSLRQTPGEAKIVDSLSEMPDKVTIWLVFRNQIAIMKLQPHYCKQFQQGE
jgi:hypothetical protein